MIEIINKITNHITLRGEKKTSEKVLLKSIKELQKESKKQTKEILQLAILNSTPIFKLHKISYKNRKKRNKKAREIPAFIHKTTSRTSSAIKFIVLSSLDNKSNNKLYLNLKKEMILTAKLKSNSIDLKNESQKQVLSKKRLFRYYRW